MDRATHLHLKSLIMIVLFCKLYSNTDRMRILKELDRQSFKNRFKDKYDCYTFLAE